MTQRQFRPISISTYFSPINMKKRRIALILISLLLAPLAGYSASDYSLPLPLILKATDPKIQLTGRFDLRGGTPRCSWSGSAITIKFRGTDLNLLLRDAAKGDAHPEEGFNSNYFTVRVDGGETTTLRLEPGRERYPVASGLPAGIHTVTVAKRTESNCGGVTLLGVEISADGEILAPPPRPSRRIEFIGDSITCGYGNEAPDQHQKFTPATENNDLAYGALAARRFGAEYVCIAWSGIGVYSSRGDLKNTMNTRYERSIGQDPSAIWAFTAPPPQVVVINLGTNDFAQGDPGVNYIEDYKKLVHTVRGHYPQATIFCAMGPIINGANAIKNKEYIETIITDLADANIFFVSLGTQDINKNGIGGSWHPSLKTHLAMVDLLVPAIEAKTDWKSLNY